MQEHFDSVPRRPAVSTTYLERLQNAMTRATVVNPIGGMAGSTEDGSTPGAVTWLDQDGWMFVKLTEGSFSSSDPMYGGTQVIPDTHVAFSPGAGFTPQKPGLTFENGTGMGSPTVQNPIYEINGRTDVPINSYQLIVRGYRRSDGVQEWLFTAGGTGGANVLKLNIIPGVVGVRDEDGNPVSNFTGAGDAIHLWLVDSVNWDATDGDNYTNNFYWLTTPYQYAMLGQQGSPFFEPGNSYTGLQMFDDETGAAVMITADIDLMDGGTGIIGTGTTDLQTLTLPLYQSTDSRAFVEIICVSDGVGGYYPQGVYGR